MLKPSDFNNAVPQFSNGNYASNPINPQYVEEPSSTDYNHGTEPLQTLPAQWWNWFMNKFTSRFNKVNIYVKNLFNELAQLLSLVNVTPDGTEGAVTDGQLKNAFKELYPDYINTKLALESTYVKKTQKVNNHALSGDVTVTKSDVGLGNVPNVSTNDQTPSYTEASTLTALSSGEKLSIAFGKLAKAVSSLISHISNTSNPHSVTKAQVQLGNVVNTGDSATPAANGTTKFTTGGAWTNTYPRSTHEIGRQVTYITYDNLYSRFSITTNTYLISLRNGETGILTCGTTDGAGYTKPTYIKLVDGTAKILNIYWNQSAGKITLFVGAYTYISVTQIGGIERASLTYTESTTLPTGVEAISTLKTVFTTITDQILSSLAPSFSTSTSYAVGDFVMYDSRLYRCTTAHSAGAWNASHFTADSLSSLVKTDLMQWNKAGSFNISDANNLTKAGCYTGYNLTNAPDLDGWYNYLIMTCDKSSQYVTQLALGVTRNNCYIRNCIGGAWYSWDLLAFRNDITKDNVGLGNVVNTGDSDTPVSGGTTKFTTGGAYNLLTSLAPIFSTSTPYAVGDMVTYNGVLYTCTTAHSAGAWNASHFTVANLNNFYNFTNGEHNPKIWTSRLLRDSLCKNWVSGIGLPTSSDSDDKINYIYYANGIWVALGRTSSPSTTYKSWWSTDGVTWTQGTGITHSIIEDVYFANGIWVAVGYYGMAWSTDGKAWTEVLKTNANIYNVLFANGIWVAMQRSGSPWWSTDGKNWTQSSSTISSIANNNGRSLWNAMGTWVVFSKDIYTSSDGKTWTQRTTDNKNIFGCYGNGEWLAINDSKIYKSTDGTTWNSVTNSSSIIGHITFGNGLYVCGKRIDSVTDHLVYSQDGIHWNDIVGATDINKIYIERCFYDNGVWVFVSTSGYIAVSYDGVTWIKTYPQSVRSLDTSAVFYYSVCAHDGIWVIGGDKLKIYRSSLDTAHL